MEPIWLGVLCTIIAAIIGYLVGRGTREVNTISNHLKWLQEDITWHNRVLRGDLWKPGVYEEYQQWIISQSKRDTSNAD